MRKILSSILLLTMVCAAHAATAPTPAPDDETPVIRRVSIFSTSTDWEAITGLQLAEYRGTFIPDTKIIGAKGVVLYYLDGFPCYGLGEGVRIWMGPNNKHSGELRIACVHAPTEIKFSWRNAARDADDATGTGLLTCPVSDKGRELIINMNKCTKGKNWAEYK